MLHGHSVVGGYRSVAVGPEDCARDADLPPERVASTHLHRADEVLVAAGPDVVRRALPDGWQLARARDGMVLCRPEQVPEPDPERELPDGGAVRAAVHAMRERLPDDVRVAPNVVLCAQPLRFTIAPKYQGKDSPVTPWDGPPPDALPAVARRAAKDAVRIGIVDTGVARAHPWLPRQLQWLDGDVEAPGRDADRSATLLAGHGTFILGQVLGRAPRARVYVVRQVDLEGVVDDDELASAILRLERRAGGRLDLLNLSLGGWTPGDEEPIAVTSILRRLHAQGTVVVAAAGNLGSDRPFWPGAMEEVVAVAASDAGGRLPAWANGGAWVDAAMPATAVAGTYFDGFTWHRPGEPEPRRFRGWATWLGSSFAAPQLVGEVAAAMERDGCDARTAVRRVLASGDTGTDPRVPHAVFLTGHDPLAGAAGPDLPRSAA